MRHWLAGRTPVQIGLFAAAWPLAATTVVRWIELPRAAWGNLLPVLPPLPGKASAVLGSVLVVPAAVLGLWWVARRSQRGP